MFLKKKENVDTLDILCPKCSESKKIKFKEGLACEKCGTSFFDNTYATFSMSILLWFGGFAVAGYGTHYFTGSESRYPISVEYSIIQSCISSNGSTASRFSFTSKRSICISALKKTQEDIDYDDYKKNNAEFFRVFKNNSK